MPGDVGVRRRDRAAGTGENYRSTLGNLGGDAHVPYIDRGDSFMDVDIVNICQIVRHIYVQCNVCLLYHVYHKSRECCVTGVTEISCHLP